MTFREREDRLLQLADEMIALYSDVATDRERYFDITVGLDGYAHVRDFGGKEGSGFDIEVVRTEKGGKVHYTDKHREWHERYGKESEDDVSA